jgi:hypothetical protein
MSRRRAVDVTAPVLRAAIATWRVAGVGEPTVFARIRPCARVCAGPTRNGSSTANRWQGCAAHPSRRCACMPRWRPSGT